MSRLYLKFPTLEDKSNVLEFKNEFIENDVNFAGVGGLDRISSYEEWLKKVNNDLHKETCGEGRVPSTQFLTYRKEDNKLVGMVQLRHELSEYLFNYGGHIGDCVRPSEQGKGYATEQISLALAKCKELNIEKVLITCMKSNIASARTIQKNDGALENEIMDNGKLKQRYWIDLSNKTKVIQ